MVAFIGGLGATELMIILAIVLILFGAGRLPQVFKSLGEGLKSFRDAQNPDPIDATPKGEIEAEDAQEVQP